MKFDCPGRETHMKHVIHIKMFLFLITTGLFFLGCNTHPFTELKRVSHIEQTDAYNQEDMRPRKVDILFVVDNSGSMEQEQRNLATNFSNFINNIRQTAADFRIAIVTTDASWHTCMHSNQNAVQCINLLRNQGLKQPYDFEIDGPFGSGRFEAYHTFSHSNPKCLTPTTPDLERVFAENIQVGIDGSGFEKGLMTMKTALELANTPGSGNDCNGEPFLRHDAILAVVVVSDEEDCSHNPDLCTNEYILCQLSNTECVRYIDRLHPVDDYVNFLKGLKSYGDGGYLEGMILFAAITGPDTPLPVNPQNPDKPCDIGPQPRNPCPSNSECIGGRCFPQPNNRPYSPQTYTCEDANTGKSEPGTRYIDMVKAFGPYGIYDSICSAPLGDGGMATGGWGKTLGRIGEGIAALVCKFPIKTWKKTPNRKDNDLHVSINGIPTTDFFYNCPEAGGDYAKGSISFLPSACPGPGTKIDISYPTYLDPNAAPEALRICDGGLCYPENKTPKTAPILCTPCNDGGMCCPNGGTCGSCGYCE